MPESHLSPFTMAIIYLSINNYFHDILWDQWDSTGSFSSSMKNECVMEMISVGCHQQDIPKAKWTTFLWLIPKALEDQKCRRYKTQAIGALTGHYLVSTSALPMLVPAWAFRLFLIGSKMLLILFISVGDWLAPLLLYMEMKREKRLGFNPS